ncbi:MAG: hypothetical protein GF353_20490 [Candidatus Lokiarchaeota archaeon]|nr:hypothetical protein [Candidatus Lokiarchaeota archaeon]
MEYKKKLIKAVYLYGAALDGLMSLLMTISMFFPTVIIPYSSFSKEYQFAMGWAAALMFGWTVLLFWGHFKPIERKSVLLMTIFPVVIGLTLTSMYVDLLGLLQIWLYQLIGCIGPLIIAFSLALRIDKSRKDVV